MVLERGLEGRHQNLKLLEGQTGEIEELRRAGLHVSEPYTSHGSLSWSPEMRQVAQ